MYTRMQVTHNGDGQPPKKVVGDTKKNGLPDEASTAGAGSETP